MLSWSVHSSVIPSSLPCAHKSLTPKARLMLVSLLASFEGGATPLAFTARTWKP